MIKFIFDLIKSALTSLLVAALLFILTYSMITHEFPPNFTKMKKAWSKLDQLTSLATGEDGVEGAKLPAQFQQIAEGLIKGPENMERLEKEVKDLRERVQTLERLNRINPANPPAPSH